MIDYENNTNFEIDTAKLELIRGKITNKPLELIIVNDSDIEEINRDHRGIKKPTDVLSFPIDPFPNAPLGSIVISAESAKRQAEEFGNSFDDEISLLFLHGLLHLLGFDHEADQGQMQEEEAKWQKVLNLPPVLTNR